MSVQTANKRSGKPKNKAKGRSNQRPIPKHVKNYVNQRLIADLEKKYIDANLTSTSITATGSCGILVNIPQGVTQGTRVGDEVTLDKILFNMNITAANSDVFSHVRTILFQWHPNINLGTPSVADILETPTNTFYSQLNFQWRDQYTVLYDKVWSFTGTATVPTDKSDQIVYTTVWPKRRAMKWILGSTSASSNTICLLYISDSAASPFPALQFSLRVEYLDG
jgi:hypothetical protein